LSPSRALDFQRCPLLFRFRAVDHLPEPPSQAAARGTLVHAVLEKLFDRPRGQRSQDAALALLQPCYEALVAKDPSFGELFADAEEEAAWRRSAAALVAAYFALEDPDRLEPAARELFVEAPLEGGELKLRGFVDRLDEAPGSGALRVVDYKTGKAPAARYAAEPRFQLRCYALALWRLRGVMPARLQLIYLGSREIVTYDPVEEDLLATEAQLLALWDSIAATAASGQWPAVKGPLCPWCAFQDLCPEFGGAVPPVSAEGLERLGLARAA
jgi:putative RecB family exonuclease